MFAGALAFKAPADADREPRICAAARAARTRPASTTSPRLAAAWARAAAHAHARQAARLRAVGLSRQGRPRRLRRRPRHLRLRRRDRRACCARRGLRARARRPPDLAPRPVATRAAALPLARYRERARAACRRPSRATSRRAGARRPTTRPCATARSISRFCASAQRVVALQPDRGRAATRAQTIITTPRCRRATPTSRSTSGCARSSASTRWSMSAPMARWNGCRARRSRCRAACAPRAVLGRAAGDLSVHRQQSRRGGAGQAPHRRRDHRPPDAAADLSARAWRDGRDRGADGRIRRGACARPAPRPPPRRARAGARPRNRPRRGGGAARRSTPTRRCAARRLAVRPQGHADRRRPAVYGAAPTASSATHETRGLVAALAGRRVAPGPGGAPSRGRLDVLPTGRNLYSVDPRAVPTRTAWELGRARRRGVPRRLRAGPRRLAAPRGVRPLGQRRRCAPAARTSRRRSG